MPSPLAGRRHFFLEGRVPPARQDMIIEREKETPDRVLGQRGALPYYLSDGPDARSLAESVRVSLLYLEEIGARPPPATP